MAQNPFAQFTQPYDFSAVSPIDPVYRSQFERGVLQAISGMSAGAFAQEALDLEQSNDPRWKQLRDRALGIQQQFAQPNLAPRLHSYTQVNNTNDALDFIMSGIGQGVTSSVPSLLGAAASRFIPFAGLNAATKTASLGAGAYLPAYALERGEAVSRQYTDPVQAARSAQERDTVASTKAGINAVLEAAVPFMLLRGGPNSLGMFSAKEIPKGASKATAANIAALNVLNATAGGALTEGLTEGTQELVGHEAARYLNPSLGMAKKEDIINAGIIGALGGGPMSAVPSAVSEGLNYVKSTNNLLEATKNKVAQELDKILPKRGDQGIPLGSDDPSFARWAADKIGESSSAYISQFANRAYTAAKNAKSVREFAELTFGEGMFDEKEAVSVGSLYDDLANGTAFENILYRTDEERANRAMRYWKMAVQDPTVPQSMKARLVELTDFENPATQDAIARSYTAFRAGQRAVNTVESVYQLLKDAAPYVEKASEAMRTTKENIQDRIVKRNLQDIDVSKAPGVVNAVTKVLGNDMVDQAIPTAQRLLALSARVPLHVGSTSASYIKQILQMGNTLKAVDPEGSILNALKEATGDSTFESELNRIRNIPGATNDVSNYGENSFLESMLADKSIDTATIDNIAAFVDEVATGFPQLNDHRRNIIETTLSPLFGGQERVRMIMEYYGQQRRTALRMQAADDKADDENMLWLSALRDDDVTKLDPIFKKTGLLEQAKTDQQARIDLYEAAAALDEIGNSATNTITSDQQEALLRAFKSTESVSKAILASNAVYKKTKSSADTPTEQEISDQQKKQTTIQASRIVERMASRAGSRLWAAIGYDRSLLPIAKDFLKGAPVAIALLPEDVQAALTELKDSVNKESEAAVKDLIEQRIRLQSGQDENAALRTIGQARAEGENQAKKVVSDTDASSSDLINSGDDTENGTGLDYGEATIKTPERITAVYRSANVNRPFFPSRPRDAEAMAKVRAAFSGHKATSFEEDSLLDMSMADYVQYNGQESPKSAIGRIRNDLVARIGKEQARYDNYIALEKEVKDFEYGLQNSNVIFAEGTEEAEQFKKEVAAYEAKKARYDKQTESGAGVNLSILKGELAVIDNILSGGIARSVKELEAQLKKIDKENKSLSKKAKAIDAKLSKVNLSDKDAIRSLEDEKQLITDEQVRLFELSKEIESSLSKAKDGTELKKSVADHAASLLSESESLFVKAVKSGQFGKITVTGRGKSHKVKLVSLDHTLSVSASVAKELKNFAGSLSEKRLLSLSPELLALNQYSVIAFPERPDFASDEMLTAFSKLVDKRMDFSPTRAEARARAELAKENKPINKKSLEAKTKEITKLFLSKKDKLEKTFVRVVLEGQSNPIRMSLESMVYESPNEYGSTDDKLFASLTAVMTRPDFVSMTLQEDAIVIRANSVTATDITLENLLQRGNSALKGFTITKGNKGGIVLQLSSAAAPRDYASLTMQEVSKHDFIALASYLAKVLSPADIKDKGILSEKQVREINGLESNNKVTVGHYAKAMGRLRSASIDTLRKTFDIKVIHEYLEKAIASFGVIRDPSELSAYEKSMVDRYRKAAQMIRELEAHETEISSIEAVTNIMVAQMEWLAERYGSAFDADKVAWNMVPDRLRDAIKSGFENWRVIPEISLLDIDYPGARDFLRSKLAKNAAVTNLTEKQFDAYIAKLLSGVAKQDYIDSIGTMPFKERQKQLLDKIITDPVETLLASFTPDAQAYLSEILSQFVPVTMRPGVGVYNYVSTKVQQYFADNPKLTKENEETYTAYRQLKEAMTFDSMMNKLMTHISKSMSQDDAANELLSRTMDFIRRKLVRLSRRRERYDTMTDVKKRASIHLEDVQRSMRNSIMRRAYEVIYKNYLSSKYPLRLSDDQETLVGMETDGSTTAFQHLQDLRAKDSGITEDENLFWKVQDVEHQISMLVALIQETEGITEINQLYKRMLERITIQADRTISAIPVWNRGLETTSIQDTVVEDRALENEVNAETAYRWTIEATMRAQHDSNVDHVIESGGRAIDNIDAIHPSLRMVAASSAITLSDLYLHHGLPTITVRTGSVEEGNIVRFRGDNAKYSISKVDSIPFTKAQLLDKTNKDVAAWLTKQGLSIHAMDTTQWAAFVDNLSAYSTVTLTLVGEADIFSNPVTTTSGMKADGKGISALSAAVTKRQSYTKSTSITPELTRRLQIENALAEQTSVSSVVVGTWLDTITNPTYAAGEALSVSDLFDNNLASTLVTNADLKVGQTVRFTGSNVIYEVTSIKKSKMTAKSLMQSLGKGSPSKTVSAWLAKQGLSTQALTKALIEEFTRQSNPNEVMLKRLREVSVSEPTSPPRFTFPKSISGLAPTVLTASKAATERTVVEATGFTVETKEGDSVFTFESPQSALKYGDVIPVKLTQKPSSALSGVNGVVWSTEKNMWVNRVGNPFSGIARVQNSTAFTKADAAGMSFSPVPIRDGLNNQPSATPTVSELTGYVRVLSAKDGKVTASTRLHAPRTEPYINPNSIFPGHEKPEYYVISGLRHNERYPRTKKGLTEALDRALRAETGLRKKGLMADAKYYTEIVSEISDIMEELGVSGPIENEEIATESKLTAYKEMFKQLSETISLFKFVEYSSKKTAISPLDERAIVNAYLDSVGEVLPTTFTDIETGKTYYLSVKETKEAVGALTEEEIREKSSLPEKEIRELAKEGVVSVVSAMLPPLSTHEMNPESLENDMYQVFIVDSAGAVASKEQIKKKFDALFSVMGENSDKTFDITSLVLGLEKHFNKMKKEDVVYIKRALHFTMPSNVTMSPRAGRAIGARVDEIYVPVILMDYGSPVSEQYAGNSLYNGVPLLLQGDHKGKTLMDMMIEGTRTAMTVPFKPTMRLGDIVTFTDGKGKSVTVRVTKAPYSITGYQSPEQLKEAIKKAPKNEKLVSELNKSERIAQRWSSLEGLHPSVFWPISRRKTAWQFQFEVVAEANSKAINVELDGTPKVDQEIESTTYASDEIMLRVRDEHKGKTIEQLISEGKKTAISSTDKKVIARWENLEEGHIVRTRAGFLRVNKKYKLKWMKDPEKNKENARKWSELEGLTEKLFEYYARNGGWQIQFTRISEEEAKQSAKQDVENEPGNTPAEKSASYYRRQLEAAVEALRSAKEATHKENLEAEKAIPVEVAFMSETAIRGLAMMFEGDISKRATHFGAAASHAAAAIIAVQLLHNTPMDKWTPAHRDLANSVSKVLEGGPEFWNSLKVMRNASAMQKIWLENMVKGLPMLNSEEDAPLTPAQRINAITDKDHDWLNNESPVTVLYEGVEYPSVEHAYQASKLSDPEERKKFAKMTVQQVKEAGKAATPSVYWKYLARQIMHGLLQQKFNTPELKDKLLSTGETMIDLKSSQRVGNLIMDIRHSLSADALVRKSEMEVGANGTISDETKSAIVKEIHRLRGPNIRVLFAPFSSIKSSGTYEYSTTTGERLIRIALESDNPMQIAQHEAIHDFFRMMTKLEGIRPEFRRAMEHLLRAAENPKVVAQLNQLLKKHVNARAQVRDDREERFAYMYQFWQAGLLTFDVKATNTLERMAAWFRKVLGVLSADEKALRLMEAYRAGAFHNEKTMGATILDLRVETAMDKADRVMKPVMDIARKLILSSTDRLRYYNVPALTDLADKFEIAPGKAITPGKLPYLQSVQRQRARWYNTLGEFFEGTTDTQRKEALIELQSMKEPTNPLAVAIRAWLDTFHTYLSDSGVQELRNVDGSYIWIPIERVKNYFPRVFSRDYIRSHEEEFLALLDKYTDSRMSSRAYVDAIVQGDGLIELRENDRHIGFTPYMKAVNKRRMEFITERNAHEFAEYQEQDIIAVLTTYIEQGVHRAEYARVFGNDGQVIHNAMKEAVEQGLTDKQIMEAMRAVRALEGTLGSDFNPYWRDVQNTLMTYQNLILLPFALLSSVVDPLGVAVRSNSIKEAGRALGYGLKGLVQDLRGAKYDAHEELARTLDIIDTQNMIENMGMIYNGLYMNHRLRNINRAFFRYNGMETWNRRMRTAAMVAGMRFLREQAEKNPRYLETLGVLPEDVIADGKGTILVKVADIRDALKRKNPTLSDEVIENEAEETYMRLSTALYRFVDEAVLRPNSSHRATWMSDPRFQLIAHLKQYTYSFQNVILKYVAEEYKHKNYAPAYTLAAYVPFMFVADAFRGLITHGALGNYTLSQAVSQSVERSGILGVATFGMQSAEDVARGKIPGASMLGPSFDHFSTIMAGIFGNASYDHVLARSIPLGAALRGVITN